MDWKNIFKSPKTTTKTNKRPKRWMFPPSSETTEFAFHFNAKTQRRATIEVEPEETKNREDSEDEQDGHFGRNVGIYLRARQISSSGFSSSSKRQRVDLSTDSIKHPSNSVQATKAALASFQSRKLPQILKEHEFLLTNFDKIFASTWMTPDIVIIGTKCNKLIVMNVTSGKRTQIFAPTTVRETIHASSTPALGQAGSAGSNNNFDDFEFQFDTLFPRRQHACCGIHSLEINPNNTLLAVGSGKPIECIQIYEIPTFKLIAVLRGHTDMVFSVAWTSNNALISCSRDSSVKTWNLSSEKCIGNIETDAGTTVAIVEPITSKTAHASKVRDLKYNKELNVSASLGSDGLLNFWDINGQVVSDIKLIHKNETVCTTWDSQHHLNFVGSQSHISLIDPRIGSIVHVFDSLDEGWGVRSLSANNEVVTIGGGLGKISFYDLRAYSYINWIDTTAEHQETAVAKTNNYTVESSSIPSSMRAPVELHPTVRDILDRHGISSSMINQHYNLFTSLAETFPNNTPLPPDDNLLTSPYVRKYFPKSFLIKDGHNYTDYLKAGKGWLDQNVVYRNQFQGAELHSAIYSLGYNEHHDRLFAAGGPLQLSLAGNYSAIWSVK